MNAKTRILDELEEDIQRIAENNKRIAKEKNKPLIDPVLMGEFERMMLKHFKNLVEGTDSSGNPIEKMKKEEYILYIPSLIESVNNGGKSPVAIPVTQDDYSNSAKPSQSTRQLSVAEIKQREIEAKYRMHEDLN